MDNHLVLFRDTNDIYLLPVELFLVERPLPDADGDLVVLGGLVPPQRPELDGVLVFPNHGQELPVGVAGVRIHQGLFLLFLLSLVLAALLTILLETLHLLHDVGAPRDGCQVGIAEAPHRASHRRGHHGSRGTCPQVGARRRLQGLELKNCKNNYYYTTKLKLDIYLEGM